jgi:hypothetical protein
MRVKDIDFGVGLVYIRGGKGDKDRSSLLAKSLEPQLRQQIESVRRMYQADLAAGRGKAWLPDALAREYPNAGREWGWQYVFPADKIACDPPTARCGATISTRRRCRAIRTTPSDGIPTGRPTPAARALARTAKAG